MFHAAPKSVHGPRVHNMRIETRLSIREQMRRTLPRLILRARCARRQGFHRAVPKSVHGIAATHVCIRLRIETKLSIQEQMRRALPQAYPARSIDVAETALTDWG
jgi:hypothetical protein